MADEHDSIWVQSDLLPDGTYVTAVHYTADHSRILTRQEGLAYVDQVLTAAVWAQHDAAVVRQLLSMDIALTAAAASIADLRADRPPLDPKITAPLTLTPGVAGRNRQGFLIVEVAGLRIGQWTPGDARDHALNVLEVIHAVDLDAAYRRYLIGNIALDAQRASAVIHGLAEFVRGER